MEELAAGLGQSLPGVVGGLIANQQNQENAQNMFNQQVGLADTAHQREVADLKAAGLNPILSAGGGGAPTPSGSVAPMQNTMSGVASVMQANRSQGQQDTSNKIAQQNADSTASGIDIAKQNADINQEKADADNDYTREHTRFQSNVNDSIESVLPYFKQGIKSLSTDVPEFMGQMLSNAFSPLTQSTPYTLSKPWQQRHTNPDDVQVTPAP